MKTQIDSWKEAVIIEEKISSLKGEILLLKKKLKTLPMCPCCENSVGAEFCLIQPFRQNSDEFNRNCAKKFGIDEKDFIDAIYFKATLSNENLNKIIDYINKEENSQNWD